MNKLFKKSENERKGIKRMKKHIRNKGKLKTIAGETQDTKKIKELQSIFMSNN